MSTQLTISPGNAVASFLALATLAAVPSTSVAFVVGRAGTSGLRHGSLAALGIVAGDVVHLLLALLGGAFLVRAIGEWLNLLYWIAGAYLFLLAWSFKCAERSAEDLTAKRPTATGWASFFAGLVITLGDQKAIFFYLGFLPGFLDLTSVTKADIVVLILITGVSVGGVKFAYAALASKARVVLEPRWGRWMYRVAGALLALAGVLLWAKALTGS